MTSTVLSSRKFKIVGVDFKEEIDIDYFFNTIEEEETELLYSLQVNFDVLMDLQVDDEIHLQGNRDEKKRELIIVKRLS